MLRLFKLTASVPKAFSIKSNLLPQTNKIIIKRSLATRSFNPAQNDKKVAPLGYFLLIIPLGSLGLGCWQIQRKKWKEDLIKQLEHQLNTVPVPLPDDLSELDGFEYRPVIVRGEFLHEREVYIGPRSMFKQGDGVTQSGLFSANDSSIGFLVITPFKLEGRGETILINRGWVPKKFLASSTRQSGQIKGSVELKGIVRLNEVRPQFSPASHGEHFLYRDLERMCRQTGSDPIFLDATVDSSVDGGPLGGQTRVSLRNEHMSYIITWFSLSGLTSLMWYRQIVKRLSF